MATKGRDKLSEAAGYLSKYVSKERAADWLREKAGQRVFYVAPWLSRTAGASMRIAPSVAGCGQLSTVTARRHVAGKRGRGAHAIFGRSRWLLARAP